MSRPRALQIEPVTPEDLPDILALQRRAYASEAARYPEVPLPPMTESLDDLAADAQRRTLLKGRLNGRLMAAVRGHVGSDGLGHIGRLMVAPEFQGQGFGTALLEAMEAALRAQTLELFTGARSSANLRLYERLGYRRHRMEARGGVELVFLRKMKGPVTYE
ncbi:GNAT family N-acetyltransferase [Deinococcus navajonensis]|uniref:GNAT family N-acetyltransferase n=1 Tax=Deinococcus navajonensis TaxID=309884 RepID=A0ABV8XUN4_9DEIO